MVHRVDRDLNTTRIGLRGERSRRPADRHRHDLTPGFLVVSILVSVVASYLSISSPARSEAPRAAERAHCFTIAESALCLAIVHRMAGGDGSLGSAATPIPFAGGSYFVAATTHGDGTITIRADATYGDSSNSVEVVVFEPLCDPWNGGGSAFLHRLSGWWSHGVRCRDHHLGQPEEDEHPGDR